jgi:hypothetical protein
MARVNPFALYPPSFKEALREILAVGPSSKAAPPKAHQKRQPTTRKAKAKKAKAKKKRKKK